MPSPRTAQDLRDRIARDTIVVTAYAETFAENALADLLGVHPGEVDVELVAQVRDVAVAAVTLAARAALAPEGVG